MQAGKVSISTGNKVLQLSLSLDSQNEFGVLVVPDVALLRNNTHSGNVYIPAIDIVSFRYRVHDASVNSVTVDDFDFGKSNALLETRRCANSRHHHKLH